MRADAADARALLEAAGAHLDLVRAPFTLPSSRLLVFAAGEGLRVCTSEYERGLDECVVFSSLVLRGADGAALAVTRVLPHLIEFGGGVATLSFTGPDALSVGVAGAASAPPGLEGPEPVHLEAVHLEYIAADGTADRLPLGRGAATSVLLHVAPDRSTVLTLADGGEHGEHVRATEATWLDWFARCPRVRADLQEMTAFCWWVLGANTIALPGIGRAVVPSKIGYVGLWQWDAYFIAVGLRHGDIELAREQLDIAFRFPSADGQLPDVVHEEGVLATSDDLPTADRETLRRAGSSIADAGTPVPLTKPPLAAWALQKLLDAAPGGELDDWARGILPVLRRSQDWWFASSDLDGDGMPEYGHPYSSGLDDSPIFDGPLPTTSPDLAAYLVVQDGELAALAERFDASGEGEADAAAHRARAARTLEGLLALWDDEAGFFRAKAAGEPVASYAVVSLLPLLTGVLPESIVAQIRAALVDETAFATPWGVPTVAARDPDFSPERMWRGPVWININALLVEGLRASGFPDEARALAERTVALVQHGGGPHEYFNPSTGEKAATATTAFGWSAALFVDLAVQLSATA